MAGIRNLGQAEAAQRARILSVASYDISLDLTDGTGGPGDTTFRCTTTVDFSCTEPGAQTFIEVAADKIRSATLNGVGLDLSDWSPEKGLTLSGLASSNQLIVDADFHYSRTGQGLHRTVDPVDKEVYLYSQFETTDAQRAFACFDQPDLKSVFTWHATVPRHWRVISNSPVDREELGPIEMAKTVHFTQSARMSTYITALCAGPYHEVRQLHDGIDMGLFIRDSMKSYLDSDDLFGITKQGFDFFHEKFGVRYPLPKYDQIWVLDYNAGAMENFGCVTHAEDAYIYRSQVTDYEYEQRANTILHELAHMWFGDLVTMRWWDDLWLNESFAEWASHWCNAEATRFTDAWTTFLTIRKAWGYRQDQLSSTHPVYCQMPDVEAVEVNFDGITYAKGASVIKQLVAYVGQDAFVAGLRSYFAAHAWGNATFDDLLSALEQASGRELRQFAAQWLQTAEVSTLRPIVDLDEQGNYRSVAVEQVAPAAHPTLRTHRLAIGLYDLVGERLIRRDRIELDVAGALTQVPQLSGVRAADVLLLNDDDLTYAKLRLDPRSMATVVDNIWRLDSSLARALCWSAAWDMVRDAQLPARDYVSLICAGLPRETDINLVTGGLRYALTALNAYVDPSWTDTAANRLAEAAKAAYSAAEPGSGLQLAWARAFISFASTPAELAILEGWLAGTAVPAGLVIDTELRWSLLETLVAYGRADAAAIDAEYDRDRTAGGERSATYARALIPTAAAKESVWAELTGDDAPANSRHRALAEGFQHRAQRALTAPYSPRFFEVLDEVWAHRDSEMGREFILLCYPSLQVEAHTVALTEQWLGSGEHAASLRRLVAEGRDGLVRALAARACDGAAG